MITKMLDEIEPGDRLLVGPHDVASAPVVGIDVHWPGPLPVLVLVLLDGHHVPVADPTLPIVMAGR